MDLAQGELGKEIARRPGSDAKAVAYVLPGLAGREWGQTPTHADALAQLAQARLFEDDIELRLTDQNDLDQVSRLESSRTCSRASGARFCASSMIKRTR